MDSTDRIGRSARTRQPRSHAAPFAGSPAAPSAASPGASPAGAAPDRPLRRALVLQGGGALGSYQAGVYEALAQGDTAPPDWVAGVSIGAINAALIAGNRPEDRVARLREFWEGVSGGVAPKVPAALGVGARATVNHLSAALVATLGAPGFFRPQLLGPLLAAPGTPAALSLYDTAPLRETLLRLVDFDRLNDDGVRVSLGAVNIRTGNYAVFDNTRMRIGPEHVMASGALPPGFPPVEIDGELYWDGGVVSNTPLEFVMDAADCDLVICQVDLFSARGPVPRTLLEADEREKDIRYSSRTRLNTDAQMRLHAAKAALRRVIGQLPPELADSEDAALLHELARENSVVVVHLIYRKQPYEGGVKDYEFSRQTMLEHWSAGVADARRYLARRPARPPLPEDGGVLVIDPGRDP
ncbi:patatin-like phospholipase family protein [Roseomonas sp. NAR14]|uniref:Patatin-like phospholipase family protein n=1 Tax=Roseomonas acroporae TaxID=2937791 RepID=A0A9X1Y9W6_9PROT|nr:patatin-like phospholipase family protein [Roseomonas acroporae]MCK8784802.1 patatin-like phospholipase family protein [Roseomonas acroporae]